MSQHEKIHLQEAKVATYFGRKYDPKSLNTKTHIIYNEYTCTHAVASWFLLAFHTHSVTLFWWASNSTEGHWGRSDCRSANKAGVFTVWSQPDETTKQNRIHTYPRKSIVMYCCNINIVKLGNFIGGWEILMKLQAIQNWALWLLKIWEGFVVISIYIPLLVLHITYLV